MNLVDIPKWIENIDAMIDRLSPLDCEKCLPEFLDNMVNGEIINGYTITEDKVYYIIDNKTITKELK